MCIYTYMYIYRKRERDTHVHTNINIHTYVYVCIRISLSRFRSLSFALARSSLHSLSFPPCFSLSKIFLYIHLVKSFVSVDLEGWWLKSLVCGQGWNYWFVVFPWGGRLSSLQKHTSFLQKSSIKKTIPCKRTLYSWGAY